MLSIRVAVRAGLLVVVACVAAIAAAQPQPAPPPREQTAEELLVGRWRLVKFAGDPTFPGEERICVFSKDGNYTSTWRDPKGRKDDRKGTYRLMGEILELKQESPKDKIRTMRLVLVTKTDLYLQNGEEANFYRMDFRRDEGK